jgi:hypothetical protein
VENLIVTPLTRDVNPLEVKIGWIVVFPNRDEPFVVIGVDEPTGSLLCKSFWDVFVGEFTRPRIYMQKYFKRFPIRFVETVISRNKLPDNVAIMLCEGLDKTRREKRIKDIEAVEGKIDMSGDDEEDDDFYL